MTYITRIRKEDGGFTLIEVMIATGILVVGIAGVIGMFYMSKFGNARGRQLTQAVDVAQSKLDYLVNAEVFENLTSSITPEIVKVDKGTGIPNDVDIYTVTWKVTSPVAAIGSKLKRIKVRARWEGGGLTNRQGAGIKHSSDVELETLRSKN